METILIDFGFISILIVVSKIIRLKVKFLQKLYIPAALIAGFLGLFLGKQFLNIVPFSDQISNYPSFLITILFACLFLGTKSKVSFKSMIKNVGDTFLVNGAAEILQYAIFTLIGVLVLPIVFKGINHSFGLMLAAGFIGGHGTASAIGGALQEHGWEEATTIGQTFATIGLLGGIVFGVILINYGARKGYTKIVKDVKSLPEELLTGLVNKENRPPLGKETVNSISIDSLTWHVSLILASVCGAYGLNWILKILLPEFSLPIYSLALICSIVLQFILKGLKLDDYIDKKTVTHIGSSCTDFLVAFGVASINISIVIDYALHIIILSILGFIFVTLWFLYISPRFFRTYYFERGLYIFGMSTGVMATGVLLLRITDPNFESGVLEDFGIAWIFLSIVDVILVSLSPIAILHGVGHIYASVLVLITVLLLIICKKTMKKDNLNAN